MMHIIIGPFLTSFLCLYMCPLICPLGQHPSISFLPRSARNRTNSPPRRAYGSKREERSNGFLFARHRGRPSTQQGRRRRIHHRTYCSCSRHRFMAAGWAAAGDGVQLRLRAELLEPDDGAAGMGVGRRLPAPHRRRRLVRQLAPRGPPSRRRPQVHPLQGPHGLCLRDKYVLHHLVPAVHHPAPGKHGLHSTRRKSTQGNQRRVHGRLHPSAAVVHRRDGRRVLRLRLLRAHDIRHEELARHLRRAHRDVRRRTAGRPRQRREIEQADGLQHPGDAAGEGVQRAGRRRRHPRLQHLRAAPRDTVDAAEAVGVQHAAGAGAAVHGGRGGVLRDQRGRVLGVRRRRVGVPPEPARRAALGLRAHQRHRLPSEHRLAAPVHGADPRGDGHAAAEAGRGDVLAAQHGAAAGGQGGTLRRQRLRHRAVPLHGRLRQPLRLLRALPAHLHVPQHDRPQDQRGMRREMAQALALGHHRCLLGPRRRHLRRGCPFDSAQRQCLPFLRRLVEEA